MSGSSCLLNLQSAFGAGRGPPPQITSLWRGGPPPLLTAAAGAGLSAYVSCVRTGGPGTGGTVVVTRTRRDVSDGEGRIKRAGRVAAVGWHGLDGRDGVELDPRDRVGAEKLKREIAAVTSTIVQTTYTETSVTTTFLPAETVTRYGRFFFP